MSRETDFGVPPFLTESRWWCFFFPLRQSCDRKTTRSRQIPKITPTISLPSFSFFFKSESLNRGLLYKILPSFFSSFVCFVSVVLFCFRFLSFVLFLFSPVSSCVWVCRFPVLPVWRAFLFLPFCALFFSRWRRFFPPVPSPFLFFFFLLFYALRF